MRERETRSIDTVLDAYPTDFGNLFLSASYNATLSTNVRFSPKPVRFHSRHPEFDLGGLRNPVGKDDLAKIGVCQVASL